MGFQLYDFIEASSTYIRGYRDRLSWMESQGYPNAYDMDAVNERLEQEFFYKWGKGEKRCQRKIYEDHFAGKHGLNAIHKDKNKHMPASEKWQW